MRSVCAEKILLIGSRNNSHMLKYTVLVMSYSYKELIVMEYSTEDSMIKHTVIVIFLLIIEQNNANNYKMLKDGFVKLWGKKQHDL